MTQDFALVSDGNFDAVAGVTTSNPRTIAPDGTVRELHYSDVPRFIQIETNLACNARCPDFVVGTISEETDLTSLAETLLALVIRKAAQPTRDQQELVRVRAQLRRCEEASDELIAIRDERDQLRDKVTALENNMRVLQAQLDKPRRGDSGTTIRERLTEQERKMIDRLMRETPATRLVSDHSGSRK